MMMHVPYDRAFALRNDQVAIVAPYYHEGFALACGREVDGELPPPQFKGRKLVAELDSIPDFYLSGGSDVAMATRAQVEHALVGVDADALRVRKGPIPALTSPGWDIALAVKDDSRDLGDTLEAVMGDLRKDRMVAAILKKYGMSPRDPIAS